MNWGIFDFEDSEIKKFQNQKIENVLWFFNF